MNRLSIPPAVKNILIINIIVFIGTSFLESSGSMLSYRLALFSVKSPFFQPHQIITHMFMHGGFGHIFFNMFAVFMFGRVLESVWGSKKFLILYFAAGLGSSVASARSPGWSLRDRLHIFSRSRADRRSSASVAR